MQAVALIAALSLGFLLLADLGSTRQSTRAPCSAEVASRTECGKDCASYMFHPISSGR